MKKTNRNEREQQKQGDQNRNVDDQKGGERLGLTTSTLSPALSPPISPFACVNVVKTTMKVVP